MQAVVVRRYGSADVLERAEIPGPEVAPGEVLGQSSAYAELVPGHARPLVPGPAGLSREEAAAPPLAGLAAHGTPAARPGGRIRGEPVLRVG